MRKIVVTRPEFYAGEAQAITALLQAGVERVHVRKPGATPGQIADLVEAVAPECRLSLSLHDCTELAATLGVGGVHLNSRYPDVPAGFHGLVSRSCHSIDELREAGGLDYAFLSPIYESISKPGYSNAGLLEEYRRERFSLRAVPVFALGGVSPRHYAELIDSGFAGAALMGAVWQKIDAAKFRLQFITPAGSAAHIVESTAAALEGGCRWVQLRVKDGRSADILALARQIEPLCRRHDAVFLLDDRVDLVDAARADGVHLGKNDLAVDRARLLLGPEYIIGATANTYADLARARALGADYIGLGPFRFTGTKKNLSPLLGHDGYRRIMADCRAAGVELPVVAIGGIEADDITDIAADGVQGIAISGAIAAAADPAQSCRNIIKIISNTSWTTLK